ncbi:MULTISPECIES: DegV family protein [Mammaliicoccus]|uniref:DegV family protein n=1 Tax=Mammaliicoccus fleurettii TaxID=150056 RepID=A0ABS5MK57_9STAP|nr:MULTISPECIES: DegV family protein [Mammaliicoccus]MBL0846083.1 DegV family protein [Mammaliicoccus fleurettii]MBO3062553.1 DegV family protein [Mammaliicoccus fleurettii]MBS3671315.1 DegV family protein [Mammaliicoccus fleurettii]MBS3696310.1 DegV family protein [Mammaliicoccus fleurettii]MBW0764727.1 DegV family protein [Mammaliicoccus fleurettii]
MSKIKIVVDSTTDLSADYLKENNITVVPLNILIDGVTYEDQTEMSSTEFLEKMREAKKLPKTSQPAIGKIVETYDELGKDGSDIISIHMTSELSGTFSAAQQAAQMTDSKVTVIDSKFISLAYGFQIEEVVKMINEGKNIEEIVEQLEVIKNNLRLFVVIGNIDNLIKGGRIGKAKGLIGSLMNIKPIGEVINGKIEMMHNARTQNAVIKYLMKELDVFLEKKEIIKIGIADANAEQLVNKLMKSIKEKKNIQKFDTAVTTPVVSTHTGEGAIGVFFYGK